MGLFSKLIQRRSDAFLRRLETGRYTDELAQGDRLAYARANWPEEEFPTLYRDIPDDIRRPLVWDGRLLDGGEASWLMWRHLTPAVVREALVGSGEKAARFAAILTAILVVCWVQILLPFSLNLGLVTELFSGRLPFIAKATALGSYVLTSMAFGYCLASLYLLIGGRNEAKRRRCYVAAFGLVYLVTWFGASAFQTFVMSAGMPAELAGLSPGSMLVGMQQTGRSVLEASGVPYPTWANEVGAWQPVAWYYVAVFLSYVAKVPGLIGIVVASAIVFVGSFYALWTFGFWRTLRVWSAETGAPFAIPTRDSLLFWKSKADGRRDTEYRAYCRQVDDACGRLASSPLIPLGTATGVLRARGDMKAPVRGQIVGYDGESIRNHSLILGDTGSGKTRDVLRPLFKRLMNAAWGEGHKIGAYITDGKGTLWRDLLPFVAHRSDVTIIGTGDGMWGVDLLAGMSPLEVSSTFKSVGGQVSGGASGKDEFWSESASLLIMHAATLAQLLENRASYMADHWSDMRAPRPYSLSGLLRLATDEAAQKAALEAVLVWADEALTEEGINGPTVRQIEAVQPSIAWLTETWGQMAAQTKSGVVANVNVVLGKMSGSGELGVRFASGTYQNSIDVDRALAGGIVMVAVGDTEYGLAGRVVSTWLKQRLLVLAKRRLVTDPEACRTTSVALVADEYQMLVTAGADSDTTFWNIARETGVFLVAATQSVAALKQTIGDEQTANIMNLLRNKIVLSTGEIETIEYITKLAGDLPQGYEPDANFYSTQATREMAVPDRAAPVEPAFPLPMAFMHMNNPGMASPVGRDERFIPKTGQNREAIISSQQASAWRSEDKSREAVAGSISNQPKIKHDELRQGHGFAFAMIYRAGLDRADIIDLRSV